MPEPLTYEELQLVIAEQEKAITDQQKELTEFKVEYQKYLEEQAKIKAESDKSLNEQFEKYLKADEENSKKIKVLTDDITDLKQLIANENSINPESLTYTVEVSQEQIDKLKVKEGKYLELGSLYVSLFLGVVLTFVGIKGVFSKWKIR